MKCDRRALKYNSQEKCDVCHCGNVSSPLLYLFNLFAGIVNVFSENPVAGSQNENPPSTMLGLLWLPVPKNLETLRQMLLNFFYTFSGPDKRSSTIQETFSSPMLIWIF